MIAETRAIPDISAQSPDALVQLDLQPMIPPPVPAGAATHVGDEHAYGDLVRRRIDSHKRYPRRARQLGQEGEVVLALALHADGSLAAPPRLLRSSGTAALDQEALRMARAAAPFPPRPGTRGHELVVHVPVQFSLHAWP